MTSYSEAKPSLKKSTRIQKGGTGSSKKSQMKYEHRDEIDINSLPEYQPESNDSPVNLTTYEKIESIDAHQTNLDLNKSMSSPKKRRANRKERETRAKSRNYSRYSGNEEEEDNGEGKIGYEVDIDELRESQTVYEVHGEKTDDKVLKKLNDGVRKY